jgi:hypothetical protein
MSADPVSPAAIAGRPSPVPPGEQALYASRGFSEPGRCADGRATRKSQRGGDSLHGGYGSFLEDGHQVKLEVRFRGREASHPEVARAQIAAIAAGAVDLASVERKPSPDSPTLFAILARRRLQTR